MQKTNMLNLPFFRIWASRGELILDVIGQLDEVVEQARPKTALEHLVHVASFVTHCVSAMVLFLVLCGWMVVEDTPGLMSRSESYPVEKKRIKKGGSKQSGSAGTSM